MTEMTETDNPSTVFNRRSKMLYDNQEVQDTSTVDESAKDRLARTSELIAPVGEARA